MYVHCTCKCTCKLIVNCCNDLYPFVNESFSLHYSAFSPPPPPPHFLPPVEAGNSSLPAESQRGGDEHTIGPFSTSRFIMASLSMLTMEHEAVDLALLLDSGLLGLSQTIIRLTSSRKCVCVCVCVCDAP